MSLLCLSWVLVVSWLCLAFFRYLGVVALCPSKSILVTGKTLIGVALGYFV